jgi:mRNA interferase MazF
VQPTPENGLRIRSQVMIDKAVTVPTRRIGAVMGRLDNATLRAVSLALLGFLGLSDVTG